MKKAILTKSIEYREGISFPSGTEVAVKSKFQGLSLVVFPSGAQGYVNNSDLEFKAEDYVPTTPGEVVIEAVVRAGAIKDAIPHKEGGFIFVWSANSVEQIEAALVELGWEVRRKE